MSARWYGGQSGVMFRRWKKRRAVKRERTELQRQRAAVGPNGWTCHVCGDYRPDDLIGVFSSTRIVDSIPIQQNVRYCLDRPECVAGAPKVTWTS